MLLQEISALIQVELPDELHEHTRLYCTYDIAISPSRFERAQLRYCQVENAVHMGEPVKNNGFDCRSNSRALHLLDFKQKSHGRPSSGSLTVRSMAMPGARFRYLPFLISSVILGGE